MAAKDGQVQLPSEVPNPGQLVDESQVTRNDGTVVIRQRVNISDPIDPNLHASIDEATGALKSAPTGAEMNLTHELLYRILSELRELNHKPPLRGCKQ